MKSWWRRRDSAANDALVAADAASAGAERALRRLEWTVIRRLDGLLQGDYRTLMRGSGLDLADLREYQHHDDVRHIDWNVTARLQVPHVRVFTEDREMGAWFVLDLSRSVDFGSGTRAKREISAGFVGVVARLLTRHGNRVGALVYGSKLEAVIPPRTGRRHVLHLLHAMERRAEEAKGKKAEGTTRLSDLLAAAGTLIRRRSTVFVVSDFLSEPGWEKPLGQLAQRHEVIAVRLFDPLELSLPDLGLVPLTDAETGEQLWVDTHDSGFRKRFTRMAGEREGVLRESLARAGVDALELSTQDDLVEAIVRFADLRKRRVRNGLANARAVGS
ncbi:DUF58 domain-containing protein [Variovorax sp. J22R133]|uniref:DUF58 domain-containing protein n=1 Tax=Variovorax brevis TaxID=3053503 RepID=UPI002575F74A|nr:DUF58 domain-containing protein [Variovorax sp. J22R133]MDM0114166.1 DUF58 domain-containing protein [Variovorax sp. J22R133]